MQTGREQTTLLDIQSLQKYKTNTGGPYACKIMKPLQMNHGFANKKKTFLYKFNELRTAERGC